MRDLFLGLFRQVRILFVDDGQRAGSGLHQQVLQEHHRAVTGGHGHVTRQVDDLIGQVNQILRPRIAHQLHGLEDLLHIKRLAHINHVDRFGQVELLKFFDRQGKILGSIKGSPVRTQHHQHTVFVLCPAQVIQLHHHCALRTFIGCQPFFDQFIDDHLAGILHFTFEVKMVELHAQLIVDVVKSVQAPLPRFLPQVHHVLIPAVPAGKERADLRIGFRLVMVAAVRLRIDVTHPAGDVFCRLFTVVMFQVAPHPLDHMQTDVTEIIRANHFIAGLFQDVADGIAEDHVAQVAHMESLVRVRLGKLDHHPFTGRGALAVIIAFTEHGIDDTL